MTQAERAFAALHLRARVVLAIGFLVFAGLAPQIDAVGPEVPIRALAVGVGLAAAAALEELAGRRARRNVAATAGTIAEFFAFALAVALFTRYQPLVPALLIGSSPPRR